MEIRSLSFPPNPVHGQEYDHKGRRFWWNSLVGAWFQTTLPTMGPFPLPGRKQWIAPTAAFTLLNQTAAQNMFPTGGLLLASNRTYLFECYFSVTAMSTSAGNGGFALAGTATITRQAWWVDAADKGTLNAPNAGSGEIGYLTFSTAANTLLAVGSANATMAATIKGILRVGTGGTVIPQISQSNTGVGAPVLGVDSYFWVEPIGMDTQQSSDT